MVQIGETLVSTDLLDVNFCCNLSVCKGNCCVLGDSGAPIENEEIEALKARLEQIIPYMQKGGVKVIRKKGVFTIDREGEKVTTLINGKECAFTIFENGIARCAIEKSFLEGKHDFLKPISCHLYPVRIRKYVDFTAVNYDRWSICKEAVTNGHEKRIDLVTFLKEPLVRKFGSQWYGQLVYCRNHYYCISAKDEEALI